MNGHRLSSYVNKRRLISSPVLGFDFYLASNPLARSMSKITNKKQVLIKDTFGKEKDLVLDSVIDTARHFDLKMASGISHKIDSGRVYKNRYLLTFVDSPKAPTTS